MRTFSQSSCPSCGDNLLFDAENNSYVCSHCKKRFVKNDDHYDSCTLISYRTMGFSDNMEVAQFYGTLYPAEWGIPASKFENNKILTNVVINNVIPIIRDNAFRCCTNLNNVILPNGLKRIGKKAFYECSSLTSVIIPEGTLSIGEEAFIGCKNLKEVILPSTLISIGEKAFCDCPNLTSITIPKQIETIESEMFNGCTGLTSISLPRKLRLIGNRVFWDCTSLTNITIPKKVKYICGGVFDGCKNLTTIHYEGSTRNWKSIKKFGTKRNSKELAWDANTANYVIQCSNGQIEKQQV